MTRDPGRLPMLSVVMSDVLIEDAPLAAARLLKLLADPTRRRIFLALRWGETCNCELAERFGLAQNLISHHIRQLREAGLVRERRDPNDARWVYYTLDADALAEAWHGLSAMLDPATSGARAPVCGPGAETCER